MDNRLLKVFLSVADTLNFSRSAEQLHISVSAVSRLVARLEEEVGQPLLDRDRRSVRLTPAGREFREYARGALSDWQAVRRRLGSDDELAGEVSLYGSVTASSALLAPVLGPFRSAYPAVDIMLHTGDQADGIGRVLAGQDDLAVSGEPGRLSERMRFLPLLESPLVFIAPAMDCAVKSAVNSALNAQGEMDWGEIPFIVPEAGVTKEMLDVWIAERDIRPRIYAQVAGHEAIVAMVGLGLGVGIAPRLVIEASGLGERVTDIPVSAGLPPLQVGLCCLQQRLASPQVKAFWKVAGQTYGVPV